MIFYGTIGCRSPIHLLILQTTCQVKAADKLTYFNFDKLFCAILFCKKNEIILKKTTHFGQNNVTNFRIHDFFKYLLLPTFVLLKEIIESAEAESKRHRD